ncbi:hypothetical protein MKZ38_000232 [Zalerion maritima]|uniref:FAM50A/XAP5 C-terminal domain-containing protein n=1 Tax=Zalerion maritima TaxID=339359 RepID=A0AAD5WLX4_9PEZI|nr:hypothetical protein MKZ38_000232 [Zalerion maritima]
MSNTSRFTSSNKTTHERLTTNTVGLATLDDFRKRRAEVLEEQEREAREAALANPTPPNRSRTSTPANVSDGLTVPPKKKKKKKGGIKLSFEDGDDDDDEEEVPAKWKKKKAKKDKKECSDDGHGDGEAQEEYTGEDGITRKRLAANANVGPVPKTVTKAALRKQAAEREALRKEFLARQARVKETEIAIPFVFYDGSDIPGGKVRVKKGDFVWLFLDKSRKVGAELRVGGEKNANREWARVGVDDLLLVRGGLIIPHHFEFYFFIMNKTLGPGTLRLFDYRAEAEAEMEEPQPQVPPEEYDPLNPPAQKTQTPIHHLEGANDDPSYTKVVDRRWYERNKHIFPASTWQEFDPEKDYTVEIRRDARGNAFFY